MCEYKCCSYHPQEMCTLFEKKIFTIINFASPLGFFFLNNKYQILDNLTLDIQKRVSTFVNPS